MPLTSLNLSDTSPTDVTDRGVLALMDGFAFAAARDLEALTSVSGGCSPGLRRLELGGLPRLTDVAVMAISKAAGATLTHLNLRGCAEITDGALETLSTVEKSNGPGSDPKNSIDDFEMTKTNLQQAARQYVSAIRQVCEQIYLPPDNFVREPWPSHLYFEDVNGETAFDLVELILAEVYSCPKFKIKSAV